MIIDLILDRRAGVPFDSVDFAFQVNDYKEIFPEQAQPILEALSTKCEQRVKHALCAYVLDNGYNPEICDFINSVSWTPAWWDAE